MTMRIAIVFAALAGLAGCASDPPACGGRFRVDGSLTPQQAALVGRSAAAWNGMAGRQVVTVDADAECVVRVEEHGNLGTWQPSDGSLVLSPMRMRDGAPGCADRESDCLEAVVLHELGHALGLHHVQADGSVMSADGELVLDFTGADLSECVRAGVCVR